MGRRDHDAGRTAQFPYREGEAGRGHQLRIKEDLHPVGSKNRRSLLGKQVRMDAGIVADGDPPIVLWKMPDHVIGKALGGPSYGEHVHPVAAGAQDAA